MNQIDEWIRNADKEWTHVCYETRALRVPGGMIVKYECDDESQLVDHGGPRQYRSVAMVFVPDPVVAASQRDRDRVVSKPDLPPKPDVPAPGSHRLAQPLFTSTRIIAVALILFSAWIYLFASRASATDDPGWQAHVREIAQEQGRQTRALRDLSTAVDSIARSMR